MEDWRKTGCVLCAQNCGLAVLVENGRMVKVRPDKDNSRSQGYACNKGLNVLFHQYPKDRHEHKADMLVAWGWNGMQSHQMPRAPRVLNHFAKDPDRLLVVIDIVMSETARLAHYVLPCRTYYESWDGTFFPWTYP